MTIARSEPHQSPISQTAPRPTLLLQVFTARTGVIHVKGELDFATHDQLVSVATAGHHPSMVIDLSGCTFMDCSGYRALVASTLVIEGEGRSLTITGQAGQPARLLDVIAEAGVDLTRWGSAPRGLI